MSQRSLCRRQSLTLSAACNPNVADIEREGECGDLSVAASAHRLPTLKAPSASGERDTGLPCAAGDGATGARAAGAAASSQPPGGVATAIASGGCAAATKVFTDFC